MREEGRVAGYTNEETTLDSALVCAEQGCRV